MTIVIFVALLAFLIGDVFTSGSSLMNSRKMRVGEINGKNIGYVDFLNEADYMGSIYKTLSPLRSRRWSITSHGSSLSWIIRSNLDSTGWG